AAGVGQPDFTAIRAPEEAEAAVAAIGLPCVVKPADDSGSTDVLLCHTADEAIAQAARILAVTTNLRGQPTPGTPLVEHCLDGPEFSVEMFDGAGIGITAKQVTGLPWFVEHQHVFPADLPAAAAADLAETVRRALKATGLERGAAHVEVKLTAAGPAIVE